MEVEKRNLDLIILSETKKKGNGCEDLKNYIHCYTGVPKSERAKAGISVMINKRWKSQIKSWEAINERIIKLTITIRGRTITILGIYAPNDDAKIAVKDNFEEILKEQIEQVPNTHELIIAGDLNARVGKQDHSNVVGKYGEERINDNGLRLINLCEEYELKIYNTFFKHKDIHKFTWYQNTRGLKSIIDYLISRQNPKFSVRDVRAFRGADCGSDHYLVIGKIYVPFIPKQNNSKEKEHERNSYDPEIEKYNIDSLQHESTQYLYCNRLEQKLNQEQRTTEEEYNHIKTCIKQAAQEALGSFENSKKPEWWDKDIEKKIERKKQLHLKRLQNQENIEVQQQYRDLNREVKSEVIRRKNATWIKKCEYIDQQLGGTRSSEAWKMIKKVKTSDKGGHAIKSISDTEWEQHFKELLVEKRPQYITRMQEEENDSQRAHEIELDNDKFEEAIKNMKSRKAPGAGGINPELIKYGPSKLWDMLKKLFERCLNGEKVPDEWLTSHITPIHKKGPKNNPKNYRGIAVISTIGRLYSRILRNEIEQEIQGKQAEEQAGFRAGRSTIDNLFTLKIALEKRMQRNQETHIALIDLEKAYDSVPIIELWRTMKDIGINGKLIQATKKLYETSNTRIKNGKNFTEAFNTSKGLRQGCCLSPTLFKIYLDQSLQRWTKTVKPMGLKVGEDSLFTLYFADDQMVIAQDQDDLSYMIRKLNEHYQQAGLAINMDKSEYLIVGNKDIENLPLESGHVIVGVNQCKYLGAIFNKWGNSEDEIQHRINKGRNITRSLNSILWDKDIRKETKRRIYGSIMKSATIYGAEVWDISVRNKRKLLSTEMDFLRRSCRVSRLEHIRNETIRERMKVEKTIIDDIEKRQLTWFGHVKRMDEARWPRKILEWVPPERRRRGRPRKSWRDNVQEAMDLRQLEEGMCYDRKNWKLGMERRRQP